MKPHTSLLALLLLTGIFSQTASARYLQSDPNGLDDGPNTYNYAGQNPIVYFDPNGLTKIRFKKETGLLTIDPEIEGRLPYSVPATSGTPNCGCDETAKNKGPIPSANYYLYVKDLTNPGFFGDVARNLRGDWGDWRVPLTPTRPGELHGRSGFFLHGGSFPGSAGCIDIGGGLTGNPITDRVLQDILSDPDGRIPFRVRSN